MGDAMLSPYGALIIYYVFLAVYVVIHQSVFGMQVP